MFVRFGLFSVFLVLLAFFFIFACDTDTASDAIESGTDCNEECPVGAQKISAKNASGSCGAEGDYFADVDDAGTSGGGGLSASGQCVGEGECQVVCLYPECSENQTLVITADEFRCEAAEGTSCEGVECSSHGYCRVINDAAECVCDDGYYAEGLECLPDDGFTCYDYCERDQDCFGTEHFNTAASCLTECWASFSQEQVNCAEHTNCALFGNCIDPFLGAGDDDDDDDDDDDTTDLDLSWVTIPGGTFEMGCVPQDADCYSNETPRHTLNISSFEMTATEITQQQYETVIGENPSDFSGYPDRPVETITWYEAKGFCEAVGGRLPTEAEWEYAARAGTETIYICGDSASCLSGVAWYDDNSGGQTNPVAQKTSNGFGLYDMSGNVWEWVNDWYDADYYSTSPSNDPQGPATGLDSVLRGGSWEGNDYYLRASNRNWYSGTATVVGFRCSRD